MCWPPAGTPEGVEDGAGAELGEGEEEGVGTPPSTLTYHTAGQLTLGG